ncbi:tetratricopeptide repeat protein [Spirosoma flavus]
MFKERKSERAKERSNTASLLDYLFANLPSVAVPFRFFTLSLFRSISSCLILLTFIIACGSADKDVELGRTYLKEGKFRDAIQALNRAIEADDTNEEAFNSRGVAYFELKEYANAALDYEQAIKINPRFYRPYYNRGLLKVAQNDLTGALKDYSDAIRLAPDTSKRITAELFLNRGQLFATQGQIQPALSDFSQAITLDSRNAQALYNRGNLRFQQKDLAGATSDFQQAAQADSRFGKAFYGLGITQILQDQREQGCLNLKQAQKLGYADAANAVTEYCE